MSQRSSRWGLFAVVAALTITFDQLTKVWTRASIHAARHVIGNTLVLVNACNPSTAFSLFPPGAPGARILLSTVAVGAAIAMVVWLWRTQSPGIAFTVSLGLLAAGALGNAIDRIAQGCVTDFVRISVGSYSWPAFNVADSALVAGIALMFIFGGPPKKRA